MKSILKNPVYRFLLVGLSLYLLWIVVYEVFIVPNINIHFFFGQQIADFAGSILHLFGTETYTRLNGLQVIFGLAEQRDIAVWIGEPCNGLKLFGLFSIFIIAFPAKNKLNKLWIIPFGIFLIHLINTLRVVALLVAFKHYPKWIDFNHNYTFTIIVYGFIFLLWWLYIEYFGGQIRGQKAN